MKHTFTLIFLVVSISAFGQTEKGNSFISGNLSTGYSFNAYPKEAMRKSNYSSLSVGVSYGKFVKDNIVWKNSLYGGFSRNFDESNSSAQTTSIIYPNNTVSISSVGLYYFGKDRWRGFVGGGISGNGSFYKTISRQTGGTLPYDYTQKRSNFTINPLFEVGALYFFNKHLALQLSATANSFPINLSGFSTGLVYWVKPTSFEVESKELTALQKGRWLLGAGFDINTSQVKNTNPNYSAIARDTENEGSVNLQIGKFVKDRTRVGVYVGYSTRKNIDTFNNGQKNEIYFTNYTIGLYSRKYLVPARFTPYIGFQLNYDRAESKQIVNNSNMGSSHSNNYSLGSSLGLAYIISNHFLVEAQLAEFNLNHRPESKTWGANLNAGLRPNFSLSYVF
jgi:outer membrane protein W